MVEQKPVSIKRQTIYAFIPYVNIWAFYRIQRLRKFILIALGIGFAFVPIRMAMLSDIDVNIANPFEIYSNPLFVMYMVGMYASMYVTLVYFIRRWSSQWNKKFEGSE